MDAWVRGAESFLRSESAANEILRLLWNPKVRNLVPKRLPLDPTMSIHFTSSTHIYLKSVWILFFQVIYSLQVFRLKFCTHFSPLPYSMSQSYIDRRIIKTWLHAKPSQAKPHLSCLAPDCGRFILPQMCSYQCFFSCLLVFEVSCRTVFLSIELSVSGATSTRNS
jgi:hypothetical protein